MARLPGSGDGWTVCARGHRHWGRVGAAGLLLGAGGRSLLQHRAPWTHEGGTWGVPGGARDRGEDVVTAAVREAGEEAGLSPLDVAPLGWSVADHGGWSYTTVLAEVPAPRPAPALAATNAESLEVRWWPDDEVERLALHPGLRAVWPVVRVRPVPVSLVVDGANVVGSRPDGWWRDRAGAATRLWTALGDLVRRGLPVADLPAVADLHAVPAAGDPDATDPRPAGPDRAGPGAAGTPGRLDAVVPRVRLVLEGAARAATPPPPDGAAWTASVLTPVLASGSGDDAIVDTAAAEAARGHRVVVVTADRELRARIVRAAAGAALVGPGWLLDRLSPRAG